MKRFRFRPERLLTLKGQLEHQAQQRQRLARMQFETAQAEVVRLQEQLDETADTSHADVGRTVRPDHWTARWHFLTQVSQSLVEAETKVLHAHEKLDEADRKRARLATEAEALRHLKQQQWTQHCRHADRTRQQQADELALFARPSAWTALANATRQETDLP
jgi:flagellar biosynthesis chaperone FliJ